MPRLGGLSRPGPDVATNLRDLEIMRMETPSVVPVPESWGGPGDPSPATAFGVIRAMQACLKETYGSPDLQRRTGAVQLSGSVEEHAVPLLVDADTTVTIAYIERGGA